VRELENAIERAVILSSDGELETDEESFRREAVAEAPSTLAEVERVHIERVLQSTGGKSKVPGAALQSSASTP
jgi:DNA-binding NtrC family response regulator